jgi:hypothetical protein
LAFDQEFFDQKFFDQELIVDSDSAEKPLFLKNAGQGANRCKQFRSKIAQDAF